ncbi:MAG: flagellar protein FlgN [Deferribacterota bacterium]|nr:flagellar protein FlgN [Deferribacterota bacterium]
MMDNVDNLIEVLKSEKKLYKELGELLALEINLLVNWKVDDIISINKKKENIFYKEKILEEARIGFVKKLTGDQDHIKYTYENIASFISGEEKKKYFRELCNDILNIVRKIEDNNSKIKILYKNNIKIIDEFFNKVVKGRTKTYSANKKIDANSISIIRKSV